MVQFTIPHYSLTSRCNMWGITSMASIVCTGGMWLFSTTYVVYPFAPRVDRWQMATSGVKDLPACLLCRMVLLQWLQHRPLVFLENAILFSIYHISHTHGVKHSNWILQSDWWFQHSGDNHGMLAMVTRWNSLCIPSARETNHPSLCPSPCAVE